MKSRKKTPKATKDEVLREFHHRCAICGADKPQIHHIDENPSNNDPLNLLPLCPNCHLSDQHDPTSPIDQRKISLFRRFKDPLILSSQFEPLFRRILFLIDPQYAQFNETAARECIDDLARFVVPLEMGGYYSERLIQLLELPCTVGIMLDEPDYLARERGEQDRKDAFEALSRNAAEAIKLVIEMLRFQHWSFDPLPDPHNRRSRA